jgi:hypothetical protein
MNDLDLLAPLGKVQPPDEDTMRGIAALFAAEAANEPPVRRRRPLVLAGGAVGAAAAVIGVVSLVGSLTSSPPPSASNVRGLVLSAFDTSTAILHEHTLITDATGGPPMTTDEWFSALHPAVGQQVIQRGTNGLRGKLDQDVSYTYVQPGPGQAPANCGDQAGNPNRIGDLIEVEADVVEVDFDKKNWSKATGTCVGTTEENVDDIRQRISSGQWQLVPGTTTVEGQQAIELTKTDGQDHWTLWANAETYLPIRDELTGPSSITTDYTFLPNTPENRAQLRTPIPPGYPRVAPEQQN